MRMRPDAMEPLAARPSLLRLPNAESLAKTFAEAKPFPSIVIDDVLSVSSAEIDESWPDMSWPHWAHNLPTYQTKKHVCSNLEVLPSLLREIVNEMCAPTFLRFLEKVTGIDALLADPHLNGGGLHLSGPGGVLMPHTDFHTLREFWLFRRLNVILYLNDDWQEQWGGSLKLYQKGKREADQSIVPVFGRMVIFCTDARSVHGFPDPIAGGHWRRSIALYYYTAKDTAIWGGDNTTYWQQHGSLQTPSRAARIFTYRGIRKVSEVLARIAHKFNPDAGV